MKIWIKDPKTGEPSVSLTLLMVSFIAILIASFMNIADFTSKFGLLQEVFYSMVGLYFLRRANIKTKYFDTSAAIVGALEEASNKKEEEKGK